MEQKISKDKANFIKDYIKKIENCFSNYEENININNYENDIFDILTETINVFKNELPDLENSVWFRSGTAERDANIVIASLKKYLIDNGYKDKDIPKTQLDKFWTSYKAYFENELPYKDYLKNEYVTYDNWNGGTNYIDINYYYQFELHYGIEYDEDNFSNMTNIKMFIELSFLEWIKPDKRYEYTKDINKLFRRFKLPYKLYKGKIISEGYKTTAIDNKIINYAMLERKIQFAEEMILSNESLDKKCALDYIVDSLQYLISIQDGENIKEKYSNAAICIAKDITSKEYIVIKEEINEIMKIVNEFFDIRHNEYLNKSKEIRQPISNPVFIEYLYNRIYSLLFILKLNCSKRKDEQCSSSETLFPIE